MGGADDRAGKGDLGARVEHAIDRLEEVSKSISLEREHSGHTPPVVATRQPRSASKPEHALTLSEVVELACRRRCEICQQEGGAMHAIAEEVKGVATRVEAAVKTLDERRGEKRVWSIIRAVSVPVLIAAATAIITWQGQKRAEEQTVRDAQRAAEVSRELKSFRDSQMAPDYGLATKARP